MEVVSKGKDICNIYIYIIVFYYIVLFYII